MRRTDQQIADDMAVAGVRPMGADALTQMSAARSGLIHALIVVRDHIQRHNPDRPYSAIPKHHARKRRDAQRIMDALVAVERVIDEQQQGCAQRLRVEALRKERPQ
ncbi:MAG TPA: hypothetical protein DEB60_09770 [Brevundimonas sp.]|nr:hypothetical protein [Brevundimonas sp.]